MAAAAVAADDTTAVDADDNIRLLSVSFNQDSSCFAAATTADFRVFNCAPFCEVLRRAHPDGGGYAVAEMLFRSNYLALVAAGEAGRHRVEVWDDRKGKRVFDVDGIRSAVRAVRVSMDYLAVVLDRTVRVYHLSLSPSPSPTDDDPAPRPRPRWKLPTALNPRGLCCLSSHEGAPPVLAFPGTARGQVRVVLLGRTKEQGATTRLVAAHSSEVACMAMTPDGAVLATASVKGTLVRVFSTMDGTCLQQVRRGRDKADIHSIAMSPNVQWLAVCSDKGTLHVFSLKVVGDGKKKDAGGKQSAEASSAVQTKTASNARSSLSFMKGILPDYFSSEWSFAQFRLPETTRYIAAFGEQNTVMIIGIDGSFYRCSFDPVNGKEMARKEYFRFLKDKDSPPIRTLAKQKELHDV